LNACDKIAEKPFHFEAISVSQTAAGSPSFIQMAALNELKKIGHIIQRNPENKKRRCKYCSSLDCYCEKCNVPVHTKCYKDFHKNKF
jgi:hypothetical protein